MSAPDSGDLMSLQLKKRKPDGVVWGSTALAANCEDSISSLSFWLIVPFTFFCGMGIGMGCVFARGLPRRRKISSDAMGVSLSRLAVVSVTCMLAMEMGWAPSLVTMKKMGRNPCS